MDTPYNTLYSSKFDMAPHKINVDAISRLLYYSFSLSAIKSYGKTSYSLRVNPSSGNLHPLECYVLMNEYPNNINLYHYRPEDHSIELRGESIHTSTKFDQNGFFVGLSAIHWRESWKYGERAFRYSQLDTGHALACLKMSSKLLNLKCELVDMDDAKLANLLGIDRHDEYPTTDPQGMENENPLFLVWIGNESQPSLPDTSTMKYSGTASELSEYHHDWSVINQIEDICGSKKTPSMSKPTFDKEYPILTQVSDTAEHIIRTRRSAQDFDGKTFLPLKSFYSMLLKLVPSLCPEAWKIFPYSPRINLALFVHRVEGIKPGVYALIRDPEQLEQIQKDWKSQKYPFQWTKANDCPDDLPLYTLVHGDCKDVAQGLSCDQDIASDSCFAVAMISNFTETINKFGFHAYKEMHWEAGYIGQILYLDAEAHGVRGTGIGCFYDDLTLNFLGCSDRYQDMYHFTVGGPMVDTRISTLQPYKELLDNIEDDDDFSEIFVNKTEK